MKRFLSLVILPLLGLSSCKAQPGKSINDSHSLLWKISGHGLAKPSYLFGTIHLICPSDYTWTAAMERSFAACKKVCFEMDMDDESVATDATAGLMNPEGKTLKDYFTKEQYERLSRYIKDSIGVSMDMLQTMKPIALETIMIAKATGCGIPVSYEANLMDKAHKAKHEVIGLETVKEQLDAMSSLPDDSTVASVMQMTDDMSTIRNGWNAMVAAYKKQDLPNLYKQIRDSKELGDATSVLLEDRTKRWIPRIEKIVNTQPTFIAVGAGHLWGDDGVIALLRRAGYSVEPIK